MGQVRRTSSGNGFTVRLNVFDKQNSEIWGEISNMYREKPIPCSNMSDFLLKLDALYGDLDYPRSSTNTRSFFAPQPHIMHGGSTDTGHSTYCDNDSFTTCQQSRQNRQSHEVTTSQKNSKPIEVFFINTIFRQNASWQGEVLWEKTGQRICFRSALELLHLIQSVLQESGPKDDSCSTALEQIKYSLKEG